MADTRLSKSATDKKSVFFLVRPYLFTLLFIVIAALLRVWPLQTLEERIPWVTFYPAVIAAGLMGGFFTGILGALLSCLIIIFFWSWFIPIPFIRSFADWLGVGVFFFNCILISIIAEGTRRAQKRAKQNQELAEAANRAKSVFLANMSHELRTPLNAILGFSRLMRYDPEATKDQVTNLDIIIQSGEHLLNLINNILDISKIEAGRILLEESTTDLNHFIHEIQSLMNVRATAKGLSFTMEQPKDLPQHIIVDTDKLRQVLLNLVGNAIKYTANGRVILRARVVKKDTPLQARLRFEIEDTGLGIRQEDQQRIFQPFVRLENQTHTESGTGLGLAICKENIELMHGSLDLYSEVGKGSIFYFEIPVTVLAVDKETLAPPDSRVIGLAGGQPRYRLLIAEDQFENRLLLHKLLEPMGFDIKEAINGQVVLDILEHWQPDLIWMDIRMHIMDGLEATRRIKASDAGQKIKIVALTAHALEEERREILASGCDDFIRKPFRDIEIFNALATHLGVKFIYEKEKAPTSQALEEVKAANLSNLPPSLVSELAKGAEALDQKICFDTITKIEEIDKELADTLRTMVEEMQFEILLDLLDSMKT